MISVVCPFYNEEVILEGSVRRMVRNLETLQGQWELIIVNDGSQDGSLEIARRLEFEDPRIRVVSYPVNRGRGYALRAGVAQANGKIVVTTEIDCSWGDDIVQRITDEFKKHPDADIIIASPHLPGGGYKNVPALRVFFSTFGNYIIRAGLTYSVTMNTGMTRGYRRDKFLALPLDENGKEMHLEIVNKALAFGYRIVEIPAILEWKDGQLAKQSGASRKSSSRVGRIIQTHLLFSLVAAPFRYLFFVSGLLALFSCGLLAWGIVNLIVGGPSIFLLIASASLGILALLVLGFGVLAHQGRFVQRELWRIRQDFREIKGDFNKSHEIRTINERQ